MLPYLFAEVTRRPARAIAAAISVAIGLALFLTLQAYAAGYRAAARVPLSEIGADLTAQRQGDVPEVFDGIVFPHSVAPIHRDEIEAIAGTPGVVGVAEALFVWSFEVDEFVVALGLDPTTDIGPGRLAAAVSAGRFLETGDRGTSVVDASYAETTGKGIGDDITLAGRTFAIVGIVDSTAAGSIADANLYVMLSDLQELAAAAPNVLAVHDMRRDDANLLFVKAEQTQAEDVVTALEGVLGETALVSSADSFAENLGGLFALVDRYGLVAGVVAFLFATAVVMRTFASSIWERRAEVGMMRAVGWRRRDISRQLVGEGLMVATAGWVVALGVAWAATTVMRRSTVVISVPWELSPTPHFLAGGGETMATMVPVGATITAAAAVVAFGLAVVMVALIGGWSALRLGRIKPAEVLRSE